MANATAHDGDIDAVADSLLEGMPVEEDDDTEEDLTQADDADADDDTDADDAQDEGDDDDTDEAKDEDEAEVDEDEPAEPLYTVKVDGVERQVPLSELTRSYSGQAFIQQRMRDVAAAEKTANAAAQQLQQERQQVAAFMAAAQEGRIQTRPPERPDPSLVQTDPIGYLEAHVKYEQEMQTYQGTMQQSERIKAEVAQAGEQAHMEYVRQEHQKLARAVPAFAKRETAEAARTEMLKAGAEYYDLSAEELGTITDSRAIRVLHDAAQFRRLMAGKVGKVSGDTPAPAAQAQRTPSVKPGAKVSAQAGKRVQGDKLKAQMKRTGSVDDVTRFLLQ